ELDDPGKLDYALVLPGFALEGESVPSIQRSKRLLLETKFRDPYFHEQQVLALKILEERLFDIKDGHASKLRPSLLKRMLQAVSTYTELKPNVMVLGINVNAVIDRAIGQVRDYIRSQRSTPSLIRFPV